MTTIIDPNANPKPPLWKLILNLIYSALGAAKSAGVFTREESPRFLVSAAPKGFAPTTALKDKVKNYVVKKGLEQAQAKIDTQPEREQVSKVIIDGLHLPGLPKSYAWLVAIATALVNMLLEVLAASDPTLLLSDWRVYVQAILVALISKFFLWIRQNSDHGTAVIEAKAINAVNSVLESGKK